MKKKRRGWVGLWFGETPEKGVSLLGISLLVGKKKITRGPVTTFRWGEEKWGK